MKINKRQISHKNISIFTVLLLMFFFTPVKSRASTLSLGIYPPITKIRTAPNTHVQQAITISNYGSDPIMVNISLKLFAPSKKNNGEIIFLPNTNEAKNFFSEHIKLLDGGIPVNQLLLSPQQHKSLTIDINVPKDQQENEYYISVLFISSNTEQTKSNASVLSEGVATNVLLSILPQPITDVGYIQQFTGPRLIDKDTIPFIIEIANQGNHYTTVTGSLTINNMLLGSKEVIPLQSTTILKNAAKYMTNDMQKSLTQVIWQHGFLFGIYKADLTIYFGENKEAFHRTIYFYSYPIIGFFIGIMIIIFSSIVAFRISKKRS